MSGRYCPISHTLLLREGGYCTLAVSLTLSMPETFNSPLPLRNAPLRLKWCKHTLRFGVPQNFTSTAGVLVSKHAVQVWKVVFSTLCSTFLYQSGTITKSDSRRFQPTGLLVVDPGNVLKEWNRGELPWQETLTLKHFFWRFSEHYHKRFSIFEIITLTLCEGKLKNLLVYFDEFTLKQKFFKFKDFRNLGNWSIE